MAWIYIYIYIFKFHRQNVRQVATALQPVQRAATSMEVAGCSTRSYTQMAVQRATTLKWLFKKL